MVANVPKCFQKFWMLHIESNKSTKETIKETISMNQDSGSRYEEKQIWDIF